MGGRGSVFRLVLEGMANKKTTDKDKTIALLKEEKESLIRLLKIKTKIKELSEKKRICIVIILTLLILLVVFFFVFSSLSVNEKSDITKEEFLVLLNTLDNRCWKIKNVEVIEKYLYSSKPTTVITERRNDSLIIRISNNEEEWPFVFSFNDGKILGFINSSLFYLYSSFIDKESRALVLVNTNGEKVSLY